MILISESPRYQNSLGHKLIDKQGPRAQIDRSLYKVYMREELRSYPNLSVVLGSVADIVVAKDEFDGQPPTERITGVRLESGEIIPTSHVVITTGTFLGGRFTLDSNHSLAAEWAKLQHLDSVNH